MLRKMMLSILMVFSCLVGYSQVDTIEVSKDLAATLIFKNTISTPVFGNNPKIKAGNNFAYKYYDVFVKDNVLITSAKSKDVPFTTLTIIFENGKVFRGYIKYNQYAERNYYDYTTEDMVKKQMTAQQIKKAKQKKEQKKKAKQQKKEKQEQLSKRLGQVIRLDPEIQSIGKVVGDMMFQVGNLRNDNQYSYIKLDVKNNSSTVYNIDGIMLRYIEREGFLKNKEKNKKRIFPEKVRYSSDKTIGAHSNEDIAFAIDSFGTEKGELIIKLMESGGDRDINIAIPISKINSAKTF